MPAHNELRHLQDAERQLSATVNDDSLPADVRAEAQTRLNVVQDRLGKLCRQPAG